MSDQEQLIRALEQTVIDARMQLADFFGSRKTFRGRRDLYTALGYRKTLQPIDYRERYERGGIAKRIVDALPTSTWRGGAELVENEDPETETEFERQFFELNKRLKIWSTLQKADVLSGLGPFSVIVIGSPGMMSAPLKRASAASIKYLSLFSARDVTVKSYEERTENERFGWPATYNIKKPVVAGNTRGGNSFDVHWSRIIHVAEGTLDDPVFGTPRLRAPWNNLDDLDKVVGGGAEAFWKRADRGTHIKLDPMLNPSEPELAELKERIAAYTHDIERILTTRGVDIENLGSDVADFSRQCSAILDLISATIGIPQRILMGSERGELASSADQTNYDDRVEDRRNDFADALVRQLVDRLILIGALPQVKEYEIRWPEMKNLTDAQRMTMAVQAAEVNAKTGAEVILFQEIRDRILGWPMLEDDIEPIVAPEETNVEEDDSDTAILARAARSANKKVRLLRLTRHGRNVLRGAKAA